MSDLSLICMPWHAITAPSLALGVLQSTLNGEGLRCSVHSLFLDFLAFARSQRIPPRARIGIEDYVAIGDAWFLDAPGEWAFAAALREPDAAADRSYLATLRRKGMPNRLVKRLRELREHVPSFLEECATRVLADRPAAVGFSTSFGQVVASLSLARVLRRREPGVRIVFGGANCEGDMGAALLRSYPDLVDVVVRGEGERVLPPIVAALRDGGPVPRLAGVCCHAAAGGVDRIDCGTETSQPVPMADVPPPDFDDYFARLEELGLASEIEPVLPYESSRGCWWGQKSHCSFCGLNGRLMEHRHKPAERVARELGALADRHHRLDFTLVDNILALEYFDSLLPRLRDDGNGLRLFYQTKSNLTRAQVRLLRDAGVHAIRPGVESLSTPILQLMRKGVSGIQNLQVLKWCAEDGVHAAWNIIYGLPGEPPEEYARMAAAAPLLVHLPAPSLARLTLDRFSPYWHRPGEHGIRIRGAPRHLEVLHDVPPQRLGELAWTFDYELADGRQPEQYVSPLRAQIEVWRRDVHQNRGALTYRRGPSFLVIDDRRTTRVAAPERYVLDEFEARVYLACDAVATVEKIARALGTEDVARIRDTLAQLCGEGLTYEEDGRFLSLATEGRA